MDFTISCSQGHIAEHHDKRDYYPDNAEQDLQADNKTIVTTQDYDTAFREFFQESVDAYNAKQKRADRRKTDYLEEIENGDGKEHPYYEYVIQVGNHETNGTLDRSPDAMKARQALDNAMGKLQEKYPSLKFWFIGSHGDEPNGTYHYHVCFTPVGTGYKNGMEIRCSLTKALNNMGFVGNGKPYPIDQWKQDVEHLVEDEMAQLGLGRAYKNEHRKRLDVSDYRREQMVKDAGDLLETAQTKNEEASQEWDTAIKFHKTVKQREQAVTAKEQEQNEREKELDEYAERISKEFIDTCSSITGQEYDTETDVETILDDLRSWADNLSSETQKAKNEAKNVIKTCNEFIRSQKEYDKAFHDKAYDYVKRSVKDAKMQEKIVNGMPKQQATAEERLAQALAEINVTVANLSDTEVSTDRNYGDD